MMAREAGHEIVPKRALAASVWNDLDYALLQAPMLKTKVIIGLGGSVA